MFCINRGPHGARTVTIGLLLFAMGCAAVRPSADVTAPSDREVIERALFITDPQVMRAYPLRRVLAEATAGGVSTDDDIEALLNAIAPRRSSGSVTSFAGQDFAIGRIRYQSSFAPKPGSAIPTALVNRYDLAAPSFESCGEYRIVYSMSTGLKSHANIAIEATVSNPESRSLEDGCRRVAEAWWQLAMESGAPKRLVRLERILFDGDSRPRKLGRGRTPSSIRIRVGESSQGDQPIFRQYLLDTRCEVPRRRCKSVLSNVPLDNLAATRLFDAALATDEASIKFRQSFLHQVSGLAVPDVNALAFTVPPEYAVVGDGPGAPFNYMLPFMRSRHTTEGRKFRQDIQRSLELIGSSLSPEDVISRAEFLNCYGCHLKGGPLGGGIQLPKASSTGEHIRGVDRHVQLSTALTSLFIPYRLLILRAAAGK